MNLFRRPRHSAFGLPVESRFFFEEPTDANPGAGLGGENDASLFKPTPGDDGKPPQGAPSPERVDGEKLPDFGKLGKKPAAEPVEPSGASKAPSEGEKAPTVKPDAKAVTAKEPQKPASEPKKAAEPAKAAAEPAKGPKPGEKKEAKGAEAKKELPDLPEDDKDLDALQPKPGAPAHVIKNFSELKAKAIRERETARAYKAELESARAEAETLKQSVGKVPKEVEEELTGLRNLSLVLQAENDPLFKKDWDSKIEAADTRVYDTLKKYGLADKFIEEIKAGGGIDKYKRRDELIAAIGTPMEQADLVDVIKQRRAVEEERANKIKELTGSREKFHEAVAKREDEARVEFSKKIEQKSIQLAAENDWILEQDVPENATDEQKKAIEEANKVVKTRADKFGENVRASYSRDPEAIAELAINAVKAEYLQEQLDSITKERDKSAARVTALEAQLAKIKNAGRLAHIETPSSEPSSSKKTTVESGKIGGDGASAINNFFNKK